MYPCGSKWKGGKKSTSGRRWAGRICLKVAMAMKSCKSVEGFRTTSGPEWAVLDVGVFSQVGIEDQTESHPQRQGT